MKKTLVIICIIFSLFIDPLQSNADDKIGFINVADIFGKSDEGKKASEEFKKLLVKASNEDLEARQQEILKRLVPLILRIAAEIQTKGKYTAIIDLSVVPIAAYDKSQDMSSLVIQLFNKNYERLLANKSIDISDTDLKSIQSQQPTKIAFVYFKDYVNRINPQMVAEEILKKGKYTLIIDSSVVPLAARDKNKDITDRVRKEFSQ
jgi:Skp family chaperone for outer membrane proteins